MPSLTTVSLVKNCAFTFWLREVLVESASCSPPSFLDITPALQQYLSFPLSFTHNSFSHQYNSHTNPNHNKNVLPRRQERFNPHKRRHPYGGQKYLYSYHLIIPLDEQIARFNEALSLVKTFTASSLSKETASDIESSLKSAPSLLVRVQFTYNAQNLDNNELTKQLIRYMEVISNLRTGCDQSIPI